jgi:3-methyladenine DNA glycosylase AlkD
MKDLSHNIKKFNLWEGFFTNIHVAREKENELLHSNIVPLREKHIAQY